MKTNNDLHTKSAGNLWFGFTLGMILGGGGLYLLGTKSGRNNLKKIIDTIENLEINVEDLTKEFESESDSNLSQHFQKSDHDFGNLKNNIETVIDKIKHVLPAEK